MSLFIEAQIFLDVLRLKYKVNFCSQKSHNYDTNI